MSIISLKNIKKNYPLGETVVHALKGIDLDVEKSDFLSIIGPSGSGKTTLLNIIGCIDDPTEGNMILNNQEITGLKDKEITNIRLNKIGFIFQTFNLIPVLNIRENVEFPLLLMKKFTKEEINKKVEKVIEEVGLTQYIDHRPSEY